MMMAAMLMVACGDKQKNNGKPVDSDKLRGKATATTKAETAPASSDDPFGIASVRKAWTGNPIDVDAGDVNRGIEQFAIAFCEEYPQVKTNEAMLNYFMSECKKNELYDIISKPRNGYARCIMRVETTQLTEVCYWNRQNDHKLFAAFMTAASESGEEDNLVVFYDYDPATDVLTPEPELTNMIERRVKGYDSYSVDLPDEGKDIVIHAYTVDKENDSAESDDTTLKWNGMSFE